MTDTIDELRAASRMAASMAAPPGHDLTDAATDRMADAVLDSVPDGWARVDGRWVHIASDHVVVVEGLEWSIEHSLTCRLAGMLQCPVHEAMLHRHELVVDPQGRYQATINDGELILTPLVET